MKFGVTQKESEHSEFPEEGCHIGGYKTDALRLVWSKAEFVAVCRMFSGTDKDCLLFPSAAADSMRIMLTANNLE